MIATAAIVKTIVAWRDLGRMAAEGVETQEQLAQLKTLDCQYIRIPDRPPMDSQAAEALLAQAREGDRKPISEVGVHRCIRSGSESSYFFRCGLFSAAAAFPAGGLAGRFCSWPYWMLMPASLGSGFQPPGERCRSRLASLR
jgi:hypothetical protein